MSTTTIFRKGLNSLLNGAMMAILAKSTGTEKVVELLRQHFTFTAQEMAQAFQNSYGYALATIGTGLVAPEQQRGFLKQLFSSQVESEFSQSIEQNYLQPFAQQQAMLDEQLQTFRQTAVEQCKQLAKLTLFQTDNINFTESELASFVTENGSIAITDLVIELVQMQVS